MSLLFFNSYAQPLHPPSFPTRRSSDLTTRWLTVLSSAISTRTSLGRTRTTCPACAPSSGSTLAETARKPGRLFSRSEEHTSELQSLTNLVCRLLLEKKKKDNIHKKN